LHREISLTRSFTVRHLILIYLQCTVIVCALFSYARVRENFDDTFARRRKKKGIKEETTDFIVLFHWRKITSRKSDDRAYRFSRWLIILNIMPAASFVFHLLQILIKIY